ncbi:MAG: phage tail family protein [Clostridia bacterium]|nr:phage tail family protein [Clostridia bacterium]
MSMEMKFKNALGEVVLNGDSCGEFRICEVEGLGPVLNEYITAVYSNYDGQETLSQRAMPRAVTMRLEVASSNSAKTLRDAFRVLGQKGTLYIKTDEFERRICCSQIQIPDVKRVLKGQIATFTMQLICDSPYFEDAEDKVEPLYKRTKLLSTPFTLPTAFGEIVLGSKLRIDGSIATEPVITLHYPEALETAESIVLTNETTGKTIRLDYAPQQNDTVTVDIKSRKITSSIAGNIINYLADDSFLGDFVLVRGLNIISVNVGDVTAGFTAECRYNNLYSEAVIV